MFSDIIYQTRFIENKYSKLYFKIIDNRQQCPLPDTTYTETHHILPKCMSGQNHRQNLVRVSAREHFILHWLLTKMVDGQFRYKMLEAFQIFSNNKSRGLRMTSRAIASMRQANAIAASVRNVGNTNWKSRGECSTEQRWMLSKTSSNSKWVNDCTTESFTIDHAALVNTGRWSYGRLPKSSPIKSQTRKHCEFCDRTITESNYNKFHGIKCKYNPINVLVAEVSTDDNITHMPRIIDRKMLTCVHCGTRTTQAQNFSRWHGDNCMSHPDAALQHTFPKPDLWKIKKESLPTLTCVHCGFSTKIKANLDQYHDDNCKHAPVLSSARLQKINKPLLACQHCGFSTTSGQAYKNHHGDNCKHNLTPSQAAIEFRRKWTENISNGLKTSLVE